MIFGVNTMPMFKKSGGKIFAVLKNADGDTLEVEGDECDFKAMAVAIEIAGTTVERR